MKKDIIFYSNHCTYCKEVINQISKTPINDNIMYVCVDDDNIQLPPFVKSVPTIYLVNDKKIVVDEAISEWIKEKVSKPKNDEVQAYYGACDNSYGGSFSTIDNVDSKPFISSYTFLGDEQKIETPDGASVGSDGGGGGKSNSLSNNFDQMQQSRNNDFNMPQRR
jgi:hypothetical protein